MQSSGEIFHQPSGVVVTEPINEEINDQDVRSVNLKKIVISKDGSYPPSVYKSYKHESTASHLRRSRSRSISNASNSGEAKLRIPSPFQLSRINTKSRMETEQTEAVLEHSKRDQIINYIKEKVPNYATTFKPSCDVWKHHPIDGQKFFNPQFVLVEDTASMANPNLLPE